MTQKNLTKLIELKVFGFFWHFLVAPLFISVNDNISFAKAAEQAKASPALVAKDPSTSTNKKEEEDLAKGEEFFCPRGSNVYVKSLQAALRRPRRFFFLLSHGIFFFFCAQLSSSR